MPSTNTVRPNFIESPGASSAGDRPIVTGPEIATPVRSSQPPLSTARPEVGVAEHGGAGPGANTGRRRLPQSSPAVSRLGAQVQVALFDPAKFDRAKFFDGVRKEPFPNVLTGAQVKGMEAVLGAWTRKGLTDLRWLAYMFATVFHETARTMEAIEEFGKGRGRPYGRPDPVTGKVYDGRGLVQLTWKTNYEKMGALLLRAAAADPDLAAELAAKGGADLVHHPELALEITHAVEIMFEGMTKGLSGRGDFTGKSLEDYFTSTTSDWEGARRIINGKDKAKLIAGYAREFYRDLIAAQA